MPDMPDNILGINSKNKINTNPPLGSLPHYTYDVYNCRFQNFYYYFMFRGYFKRSLQNVFILRLYLCV